MKFLCFLIVSNCFCVIVITGQGIILKPVATPCTTPNGENATCVMLFDCPILLNAAASKKDPIAKVFIHASGSACGKEKFTVCCGTASTFTKIPSQLPQSVLSQISPDMVPKENKHFEGLSKAARKEYVAKKLLPSKIYCGLQHTDDYFYNSTETSIDEFPWMVLVPTKVVGADQIPATAFSVGTLINVKYILTDKKVPWGIVLLGYHHIYKDVSCIDTTFGSDDCTTPTVTEIIEEIIPAEGSNFQLLRLLRRISYSDFIRPICLPIEETETPRPGDPLLTSGWGEEETTESKDVTIKKRIQHTLLIDRECELGNPVPNPICAITFSNSSRYVCPGDNGGPLMYRLTENNKNWVALGIITGTTSCIKYQPVVAQRITPTVLDWILSNMKP